MLMTWPQARHTATHVPDADDPLLSIWRISWVAHILPIAPAEIMNGNIFFPEQRTLAYTDAVLMQGLVAAPLIWAGLSPVLVYNLLILAPIGAQLRREIVAATYLHTDDTSVTVLGEHGGSFTGRLWTYLDPLGRQVVFDATATHERDGPETFLLGFRGALQADAYAGYDAPYRSGRVLEIGCWAHARRRFVEALMTDTSAALMVALIQQLYQVERAAAGLDPDMRRARRQDQSVPLLARIDVVRQDLARTVLPKSPLGDAVRDLTNQWTALQRFVDDGRLAIDNKRAENQLRVVAVGRKNWLFVGSLEGAHRAALLYSLVQSCKLVDVPPFEYLKDVLLRIATHPPVSSGS